MKVQPLTTPWKRQSRPDDLPGVTGTARLDRRTKDLTKRLRPGDIAIIDHEDLDRVSVDALIDRQVAAVVNAAPSISGRYPHLGPERLLEAGIPLVDGVGPELFGRVSEGMTVRLDEGALYVGSEVAAKGTVQTTESIAAAVIEARAGLAEQVTAFAVNTLEYVQREQDMLLAGIGTLDLETRLEGRHVLAVARGYHYREDLAALRSYIREFKPVKIGVDGGADALLDAGYQPDIIVGDMDSASDAALRCGAEIVVHAYPDGRAPGVARVGSLGLQCVLCPGAGTSEDIALLLADTRGAKVIVAVGTHFSLEEFLDKGRPGMGSTFLTRLRVGGKLVDAKGVSRLYRPRVSGLALATLIVAALTAVLVALIVTPVGQVVLRDLGAEWDAVKYWFTGLFH
ncbi:MAG: hypothetical protein J2P34_02980 [Actinobacteria bacterium]|nr:hypothetical protein [Actinomycetota bacterium]